MVPVEKVSVDVEKMSPRLRYFAGVRKHDDLMEDSKEQMQAGQGRSSDPKVAQLQSDVRAVMEQSEINSSEILTLTEKVDQVTHMLEESQGAVLSGLHGQRTVQDRSVANAKWNERVEMVFKWTKNIAKASAVAAIGTASVYAVLYASGYISAYEMSKGVVTPIAVPTIPNVVSYVANHGYDVGKVCCQSSDWNTLQTFVSAVGGAATVMGTQLAVPYAAPAATAATSAATTAATAAGTAALAAGTAVGTVLAPFAFAGAAMNVVMESLSRIVQRIEESSDFGDAKAIADYLDRSSELTYYPELFLDLDSETGFSEAIYMYESAMQGPPDFRNIHNSYRREALHLLPEALSGFPPNIQRDIYDTLSEYYKNLADAGSMFGSYQAKLDMVKRIKKTYQLETAEAIRDNPILDFCLKFTQYNTARPAARSGIL